MALVDTITCKSLAPATALKDQIKREFQIKWSDNKLYLSGQLLMWKFVGFFRIKNSVMSELTKGITVHMFWSPCMTLIEHSAGRSRAPLFNTHFFHDKHTVASFPFTRNYLWTDSASRCLHSGRQLWLEQGLMEQSGLFNSQPLKDRILSFNAT